MKKIVVSQHQAFLDEPILFENVEIDESKIYFVYIGEIKAYGLNIFLKRYLEKVYGVPFDFIAIVPDLLSEYKGFKNIIVYNPDSYTYKKKKGILVNCRLSLAKFFQEVSSSKRIRELFNSLCKRQDRLFIHLFESLPEIDMVCGEKVSIICPDPVLAHKLNNKLYQHELAIELGIPVPEGKCCKNLKEAIEVAKIYFNKGDRIFITQEYSAAGSNSIFANNVDDIKRRFGGMDQAYLVTRLVPHIYDPTVLGVVGNEKEVYIASVADQQMEENKFRGSSFPTELPYKIVRNLKEYTRKIGYKMGEMGYRGIFGCDYIVDAKGNVYFVEINARKQGTTMETVLTMLHRLPKHPTLLDMEFEAVTNNRLPDNLIEMDPTKPGLSWEVYNVKPEKDLFVIKEIPKLKSEMELFAEIAKNKEKKASTIVEDHLGEGLYQRAGGFVARIISVGNDLNEVRKELDRAKAIVEESFLPWTN